MRIAPVQKPSLYTRVVYFFARRKVGKVPAPLTLFAHNPWIMQAYGMFELAAERAGRVDKRLKTLASIKTSAVIGCPW